jgi:hypothetical protein
VYPLDLMQEVIGFGYCTLFYFGGGTKEIEILVRLLKKKCRMAENSNCNKNCSYQ